MVFGALHRIGRPQHLERFNATLRLRLAHLVRKSLSFCRKQANLETLLRLSGSSPTVTTHHSPEPSTDGRPLLTGDESKEPGAEADDNLLDELVDIAEAVKKGVLKP